MPLELGLRYCFEEGLSVSTMPKDCLFQLFVLIVLASPRALAADGCELALSDYVVWRATRCDNQLEVTKCRLDRREDVRHVPARLEAIPSIRSAGKWNNALWITGWRTPPIRTKHEKLLSRPLLPDGQSPSHEAAWRYYCAISQDGRYAMGCSGWWPVGTVFQLYELRSESLICRYTLPGTTPWNFSGFVQSDSVFGYLVTADASINSERIHEARPCGAGEAAISRGVDVSPVISIPKGRQWRPLDGMTASAMLAAPSGDRVLVHRNGSVPTIELLDANLTTRQWVTDLATDDSQIGPLRAIHWSTDGRLICVIHTASGSGTERGLVIYLVNAANGGIVSRQRDSVTFVDDAVIVIAPRDDVESAMKDLGIEIVPK